MPVSYSAECSYIDRNLAAAGGGSGWMMATKITKKNETSKKERCAPVFLMTHK